ncbi:MAG: hypothetical protein ACXABV_15150 [Candidatus Thorarchaeota archaeon]
MSQDNDAETRSQIARVFVDYFIRGPWLILLIWVIVLLVPLGTIIVEVEGSPSYSYQWISYGLIGIDATTGTNYAIFDAILGVFPINPVTAFLILCGSLLLFVSALLLTLALRGVATVKLLTVISVSATLGLHIITFLYTFAAAPAHRVSLYTLVIPFMIVPIVQVLIGLFSYSKFGFIVETRKLVRTLLIDPSSKREEGKISLVRGGEFVGNRLRFKAKIENSSGQVITDLIVSLLSYPRDSLKLESDSSKSIAKLEPGGFRSPSFDFLPTQDCVKGDIIATVSFVDFEGEPHALTTEPYTIRAVCDLLNPKKISPSEFELKLSEFTHGDLELRVEDWTPEEMQSKAIQVLESSNFAEITNSMESQDGIAIAKVSGWAVGKYTGKSLALETVITGRPGIKGATCVVRMSGEDDAMIMPALDEIAQKLRAWLCPLCGGKLSSQMVDNLKGGRTVECPFCNVAIGR